MILIYTILFTQIPQIVFFLFHVHINAQNIKAHLHPQRMPTLPCCLQENNFHATRKFHSDCTLQHLCYMQVKQESGPLLK